MKTLSRLDHLEETLKTALAEIELIRIEYEKPKTKPRPKTKREEIMEKYRIRFAIRDQKKLNI